MRRQQLSPTPVINPETWAFTINGRVRYPKIWSWSDLASFSTADVECVLLCSHAPADARETRWSGIPLQSLLGQTETLVDLDYAKAIGVDGYSTVMPLEVLREGWLVTARDGQPLTYEDGFPARLIVPGHVGLKMAKWLQRVEIVSQPDGGFWESQGSSLIGEIMPRVWLSARTIQASVGQRVEISGTAFAGNRPVTQVLISLNNGDWMPAEMQQSSARKLARWRASWTPQVAGTYAVVARAVTQDDEVTGLPNDRSNSGFFKRTMPHAGRIEVSA